MHAALVLFRHANRGGGESALSQVAAHLARAGHDVSIVCRTHEDAPHPRVRFESLRSPALGPTWRLWQFARDVERHVERARYDVVVSFGKTYAHDVVRTGAGAQRTYLAQKARFDGEPRSRFARALSLRDRAVLEIERRAFRPGRLRKVIANSRMVMDDLQRTYGLSSATFEVIHNAVDLARFHPDRREEARELRRALGIGERDFTLSFIARGFARKGLERLLRAIPDVAAKCPRVRLLVAGDDPAAARYRNLARELEVDARVRFLGERGDPELVLAASDLHVVPTWYDSFAFTVLESLACGVPVVATDSAGAAELIEPGITGAVVRGDACEHEIARAIVPWCDAERACAAREPARATAERHGVGETMAHFERVLLDVARARECATRPA